VALRLRRSPSSKEGPGNAAPQPRRSDESADPTHLRVLERLVEAGGAEPESDAFLSEVVIQLAKGTSSDRAILSLVDANSQDLEVKASHGFGVDPPKEFGTIHDGSHGWVLKIGASMVLAGSEDHGGLPLLSFERGAALLAAPIQVHYKRFGAVSVLRPVGVHGYREQDLLFVGTAAALIGGMIGHARAAAHGHEAIQKTIRSLTKALDARDPYTRGHSERVAMYSLAIANELENDNRHSFGNEMRNSLLLSALLHDIGKIGIRDDVLFKPSKLTDEEYNLVKSHPEKGAEIVRMIPGFDDNVIAGILQHHERFDGRGYPSHLAGENIHIFGRIIGLADTFDAIVTSRPYNTAASFDYAIAHIEKLSGTTFDPELVHAMFRAIKQNMWADVASISEGAPSVHPTKAPPPGTESTDRTLRRIFGRNITDLPTLPHVVSQVLEKTRDANASLADVAQLISTDQVLVSTFLRLVNSAFYGFSRRITTLKQAITLLGFRSVRNIVVNAGVVGVFRRRSFSKHYRHRLWDHSVTCALTARILAQKRGFQGKEEAFTAGLLHDIGKVVIDQYAPKNSIAIMQKVELGMEPRVAEAEVLGVDHTKIGAWIADRWHLPKSLCWAIEWHHDALSPLIPGDVELVRLVAVANAISKIRDSTDPGVVERAIEDFAASPANLYRLGIPDTTAIVKEVWAGKNEAMRTFGASAAKEGAAEM
jgi:putative nucleotidyltransferase with HDIG domain